MGKGTQSVQSWKRPIRVGRANAYQQLTGKVPVLRRCWNLVEPSAREINAERSSGVAMGPSVEDKRGNTNEERVQVPTRPSVNRAG